MSLFNAFTASRWLRGRDAQPGRLREERLYWAVVLASGPLYLVVLAHTPLVLIFDSPHDDELFMTLGQHIATGAWLGPYSQFTLMKGPGYPLFLAVGSWLGLPLSLAQALFHYLAVVMFSRIVGRISGYSVLAIAIFLGVLWHPAFLTDRIHRSAIYPGQVLLILACASHTLFVAEQRSRRLGWGAATGLLLGWFWLTREEGVWILPALVFFLLWAGFRARHTASIAPAVIAPAAMTAAVFLVVSCVLSFGNWMAYGQFIGVDFKERNFQAAVGALQSVREEVPKPYLPVPRGTRERVYAVSPAFASLRDYLDPPGGSPWQHGCLYYPATCGDIAGGWFVGALRDAAATHGHYQTPARASAFFDTLSSEIDAACRDRRLTCSRKWIPYMPTITQAQAASIPATIGLAAVELSSGYGLNPAWVEAGRSSDTGPGRDQALAFLNHPLYWTSAVPRVALRGWYYTPSEGWLTLTVVRPNGGSAPLTLERQPSPDLVTYFSDPAATERRFIAETNCSTSCLLVATVADGTVLRVPLGDVAAGAHFAFGEGELHFDEVRAEPAYRVEDDMRVRAARTVRSGLLEIYRAILPGLLGLGGLAFLVGLAFAWKKPDFDLILALAVTTWLLVATRIILLVLIHISSFPALDPIYMGPVYGVSVAAALLSIAAVVSLVVKKGETVGLS